MTCARVSAAHASVASNASRCNSTASLGVHERCGERKPSRTPLQTSLLPLARRRPRRGAEDADTTREDSFPKRRKRDEDARSLQRVRSRAWSALSTRTASHWSPMGSECRARAPCRRGVTTTLIARPSEPLSNGRRRELSFASPEPAFTTSITGERGTRRQGLRDTTRRGARMETERV